MPTEQFFLVGTVPLNQPVILQRIGLETAELQQQHLAEFGDKTPIVALPVKTVSEGTVTPLDLKDYDGPL